MLNNYINIICTIKNIIKGKIKSFKKILQGLNNKITALIV